MSLLENSMETFVIMNKTIVPDSYGGTKWTWSDGVEIQAAIDLPSSTLSKIADKMTERINCNVITTKAVRLVVNDYLRRTTDGVYLHIIQDGRDRDTPSGAGINARVSAAEIVVALPDGG